MYYVAETYTRFPGTGTWFLIRFMSFDLDECKRFVYDELLKSDCDRVLDIYRDVGSNDHNCINNCAD